MTEFPLEVHTLTGAGSWTPSERMSAEASAPPTSTYTPSTSTMPPVPFLFRANHGVAGVLTPPEPSSPSSVRSGRIYSVAPRPTSCWSWDPGASTKVRTLLDARRDVNTPGRYVAFDVSESIVAGSRRRPAVTLP